MRPSGDDSQQIKEVKSHRAKCPNERGSRRRDGPWGAIPKWYVRSTGTGYGRPWHESHAQRPLGMATHGKMTTQTTRTIQSHGVEQRPQWVHGERATEEVACFTMRTDEYSSLEKSGPRMYARGKTDPNEEVACWRTVNVGSPSSVRVGSWSIYPVISTRTCCKWHQRQVEHPSPEDRWPRG
jgi:hypothetical protein